MEHHVSAMIQTIKHKPKQPARSGHQYIAYVKPIAVENKTTKYSKICSQLTYLLKSRSLFFTAWSKRRGVETRISQCISLKFPDLDSSLVINLIQYFLPLTNFLHSLTVCAANSLVGQRITALTPPFDPGYQNKTHQESYRPI